jgi:hypothetical protein
MFVDKRILFISVKLFSIERNIQNKLELLGATVDYFDERPSNSIFVKGIIRLGRNFYNKKIQSYYERVFKKVKNNHYDYLFVIKGEVIPDKFLEKFCKLNPNTQTIYYTYDSVENNKNSQGILKYFKYKFTFDSKDAIDYDLKFQPLFYFDSFKNLISDENPINKLLFIGTAHSDRYIIANKVEGYFKSREFETHTFFYIPSKLVYFYKLFFDSTFQSFEYKKLSFKPLGEKDILALYGKSRIILDINHPKQKGLTMRTIEAIGSKKKLITTNAEVKKYTFYNENNICVIDRDNIVISEQFMVKPYENISKSIYEDFSLENWLKILFTGKANVKWMIK